MSLYGEVWSVEAVVGAKRKAGRVKKKPVQKRKKPIVEPDEPLEPEIPTAVPTVAAPDDTGDADGDDLISDEQAIKDYGSVPIDTGPEPEPIPVAEPTESTGPPEIIETGPIAFITELKMLRGGASTVSATVAAPPTTIEEMLAETTRTDINYIAQLARRGR